MKKFIAIFSLVFFIALANSLQAQPPDPGGGGQGPNCFPPPCVPIDGGLSWLLVAGTLYGGKKILEVNNAKNKLN